MVDRIRISAGQSVSGGSIDWHRYSDGDRHWYTPQWGVSGALEFADDEAGRAAADATADEIRRTPGALDQGHTVYLYGGSCGEWAPPSGADRLTLYSPHDTQS